MNSGVQFPSDLGKNFQSRIIADWIDENGHLNSVRYLDVFRQASAWFLNDRKLSPRFHPDAGTLFQAEAHIRYERELLLDDPIVVRSWLVGFDAKRLHHLHVMYHADSGSRAATVEYLHLHVSPQTRRVAPMPTTFLQQAACVLAAQEPPSGDIIGRSIALASAGAADAPSSQGRTI